MCLASCPNPRVGVSAYRKGSDVTLDLDLGSIGIRQSYSSIRRLALTPTPRYADTGEKPEGQPLSYDFSMITENTEKGSHDLLHGVCGWHTRVMARGDRREEIFRDERDRWNFLGYLAEGAERYWVKSHCYVLMENHFHLVATTPEGNLSKWMQQPKTAYTVYFNRWHQFFKNNHLKVGISARGA